MGAKYTRGSPELLVVGSASRDVAADDRRGWRLGGGVTYSALTAARLGIRTAAVVGVDREAARARELDLLRIAGVDLELVELGRIPVFDNVETPTGRVQTCLEPGLPLPIAAMPDRWRDAGGWLLAPVAGELPEAWAEAPGPAALVALGWQGLLRELTAGERVRRRPPAPSALPTRADIVGVSADDLDPSTSIESLLAGLGPAATLLLTRGYGGGVAVVRRPDGTVAERSWPAVPARRTVDPTGAGDAFLAAVVAMRLLSGSRRPDAEGAELRFAAAVASLVVERPGLTGVPERIDVARRLGAAANDFSGDVPA